MNRVTFFCELPPPFGGVTVKNKLLIDEVFSSVDNITVLDFCRIKRNHLQFVPVFLGMVKAFLRNDTIIYGFGSYKRLLVASSIHRLFGGNKSLSKSINIIMGGAVDKEVMVNQRLGRFLNKVSINLVETKGMMASLHKMGIDNVAVFPNPKPSINACIPIEHDGPLKCVFFSKICKGKGCDYIMSEMDDISGNLATLDFYGHIDNDIEDKFREYVDTHANVFYHGVFDSTQRNLYAELNKYDILLFPTTYTIEGVPGILVEAKMAGLLPIVTNVSFNSEIVGDGEEGIVIENMDEGTLKSIILLLANDREKVNRLKEASFCSRSKYSIENYKDSLLKLIK